MKKILSAFLLITILISCSKKNTDITVTPNPTDTSAKTPSVIQWQKCIGGSQVETANDVDQTKDGGYIVAGYSNSNDEDVSGNHGKNDYWVAKLNSAGSIEWQKSFGGSDNEQAYSVKQTADGGYVVAGTSFSDDGNVTDNPNSICGSGWVIKLNANGGIQWQKALYLNSFGYKINSSSKQQMGAT